MNVQEYIRYCAQIIDESYGTISEGKKIPLDAEFIRAQYIGAQNIDEKYAPTEKFLEKVYNMFNEEFFNAQLPHNLIFKTSTSVRARFVGLASYRFNDFLRVITPTAITLNSSLKLNVHEWLNVILHEMIHVYDYVNYPEHFLGYQRRTYDAHGKWFLDYGKQFEKYGFNVSKYCDANIELNTDDNRVKNMINNSVFIIFQGWKPDGINTPIVKMSSKEIEKYKSIIESKISRGRMNGLKRCIFMKSSNQNTVKLKSLRMRDEYSAMSYYYFNEDFKRKYGPFEEIETMDIMTLKEDKDEVEYEEMNHIDDKYARKIYDNIKGVVDVRKVDKNEYEVDIY